MGSAALAACATTAPRYSVNRPPARPSAKAPMAGATYKVGAPYQVGGIWYVPREQPGYDETGVASWYGDEFHMKATANGEVFDKDLPSAAHTTLPLPSLVEVTNLDNGRKLVVRVNDRGPFVGGRIIDLSHEAARQLGYDRQGLARVRVRYVGPAPLPGEETRRYASLAPATPRPSAAAAPPPPPVATPPTPSPADVAFTAAPLTSPPVLQVSERMLAPTPPKPEAPPPEAASPDAPRSVPADALASPRSDPAPAPSLTSTEFRVQAGAFSSPENARKAVTLLAAAGPAVIEPLERDGQTLYRVVLAGAADQNAAEALREKAAEAGFADARVIRPF